MILNLKSMSFKLAQLTGSFFRLAIKILSRLDLSQNGFFGLDRKLGRFFMPSVKVFSHSRIRRISRERNIAGSFGINIFRCVHREAKGGVEIGANTVVQALESIRVPYTFSTIDSYLSIPIRLNFDAHSLKYAVNLYQMTPDQTGFLYHLAGHELFNNHYNIAYWFWELETIPERWKNVMRCIDEIWTASTFTRQSFQNSSSPPTYVIPPSVSSEPMQAARKEFGLPEKTFIFLYLFDFRSYFERKNPLGAVRAFKKAFGNSGDVMLLIKCHSSVRYRHHKRLLMRECSQANIRIIEEDMGAKGGFCLISLCDAYLSLHRSEGFGLTIAEAMRLGKPVIVTAYSANMDFTTQENSHLVRYQKTPILTDAGPYTRGNLWAEPDINHAAELMRHVYEHPHGAKEKAERGRCDIAARYNAQVTGTSIQSRLNQIWREIGHAHMPSN